METKELRIGNWIQSDGEWFQVTEIRKNGFTAGVLMVFSMDDKYGIPLTVEILNQFGLFEHKSGDETRSFTSSFPCAPSMEFVQTEDGKLCIREFTGMDWYLRDPGKELDYLHQLQNCYFDFSGYELQRITPDSSHWQGNH